MSELAKKKAGAAERAELDAVLASGILDRAPLLSRFLIYICEKYFAGDADQIKEYSIATDALGRSEDFDHTRDSIVRVEAHRLRKRLKQYYEGPGADHEVRIRIPSGQYVPKFVHQAPAVAAPSKPRGAEAKPSIEIPRRGVLVGAVALSVAVLALAAWSIWSSGPDLTSIVAADLPSQAAPGAVVRISTGLLQGIFVDTAGMVWERDQFFTGGEAVSRDLPQELSGLPPRVFETARVGRFDYAIPLEEGTYELRLYFADIGQESRGNCDLLVNDATLLQSFNPAGSAGARGTADVRVFAGIRPAADGLLHLTMRREGVLNGIEIVPAGRTMHPVRILAGRKNSHHDSLGQFWTGDRYFRGGTVANRSQRVAGTVDPNLFTGERYGDFSYLLPADGGRFTLRLAFAETWYGPGNPQNGGEGSRTFHVICNGKKVLEDFDIYKTAGGENRAVVKEFHGLEPDPHGKIVVKFVPTRNNACVNSIELLPEPGSSRTLLPISGE